MTSKNQTQEKRSDRFKSIDKGDKVYIMCDEGCVVDISRLLMRSGFGLTKTRGYDPFKDVVKYDRYLLFESGASRENTENFIRLSEEMELYDERMKEIEESVVLFFEKQEWSKGKKH